MKRSEMIQVIKDALYCHIPTHKECPDYIAETVLMAIEGGNKFGEGMEPPQAIFWNSENPKDVDERGVPKDLKHHILNGDPMNYWEPE